MYALALLFWQPERLHHRALFHRLNPLPVSDEAPRCTWLGRVWLWTSHCSQHREKEEEEEEEEEEEVEEEEEPEWQEDSVVSSSLLAFALLEEEDEADTKYVIDDDLLEEKAHRSSERRNVEEAKEIAASMKSIESARFLRLLKTRLARPLSEDKEAEFQDTMEELLAQGDAIAEVKNWKRKPRGIYDGKSRTTAWRRQKEVEKTVGKKGKEMFMQFFKKEETNLNEMPERVFSGMGRAADFTLDQAKSAVAFCEEHAENLDLDKVDRRHLRETERKADTMIPFPLLFCLTCPP